MTTLPTRFSLRFGFLSVTTVCEPSAVRTASVTHSTERWRESERERLTERVRAYSNVIEYAYSSLSISFRWSVDGVTVEQKLPDAYSKEK